MNSTRPYKQVLEFLKETIDQLNNQPNRKLPSERMLAVKFNASRRSIRLAYDHLIEKNLVTKLHGKGHFTTGYVKPRGNHTPLSSKEIHLIVPFLRSDFTHDILIGISDFCEEHSLELTLKLTQGKPSLESKYINTAVNSGVKGIILFPGDNELINTEILKLSERRYPLTIIDRNFKNTNASFVSSDNFNAMKSAIKFLHSKKIKNLVYVTSPSTIATSVVERFSGFLEGFREYYDSNPYDSIIVMNDFAPETIYREFRKYLDNHPTPQVIVAYGVRHIVDSIFVVLNERGISPIKDVKFMIFDNDLTYDAISFLKPYVIKQRAYQIGYESCALLYNQIYGDLRTETKRFPVDILDLSKKARSSLS